ncbi:hypothetical protein ACTMTF_45095 [Nonomuraea sp. ZG12]
MDRAAGGPAPIQAVAGEPALALMARPAEQVPMACGASDHRA